MRSAETATQTTYAPSIPAISYGNLDLSLRACAERGGPLSGGGAGLSQILMCQMLTGTAWTKVMSRPTASVEDKMLMMEPIPTHAPVVYSTALYLRLDDPCVTEGSQQHLGREGGCACRCSRTLGTALITGLVTTTLESGPQGRNGDWTDRVRRRRELCERPPAALQLRPNQVHCCFVLSAPLPARSTISVTITSKPPLPITKTQPKQIFFPFLGGIHTLPFQRPPFLRCMSPCGRNCQMHS
jgi:hypothetical protein